MIDIKMKIFEHADGAGLSLGDLKKVEIKKSFCHLKKRIDFYLMLEDV